MIGSWWLVSEEYLLDDRAELAGALLVVGDGGDEMLAPEVGPAGRRDVDFAIGGFPEQKVGEAQFACRANQEVGIGDFGGIEMGA